MEFSKEERNILLRALEDLARNTQMDWFREEVNKLHDRVEKEGND